MHTLGFILVLFATLQEPAAPVQPNADEGVIVTAPKVQRSYRFRMPDRHEEANEKRTFVCPKDGAVLIIDAAYANKTFKCPVDETEMKAGVGTAQKKYFLLEPK